MKEQDTVFLNRKIYVDDDIKEEPDWLEEIDIWRKDREERRANLE